MGTTTTLHLPYAEPTDELRNDATALRLLAEAVEESLVPSWHDFLQYDGTTQNADAPGVRVSWPGAETGSGEFTNAGGLLTYSGAPRPFLISASLSLHGQAAQQQIVDLYIGGALRRRSEYMDQSDPGAASGWATHSLAWTGILGGGATIEVIARDGSNGAIWYPSLSVASIGPAPL